MDIFNQNSPSLILLVKTITELHQKQRYFLPFLVIDYLSKVLQASFLITKLS